MKKRKTNECGQEHGGTSFQEADAEEEAVLMKEEGDMFTYTSEWKSCFCRLAVLLLCVQFLADKTRPPQNFPPSVFFLLPHTFALKSGIY